MENQNQKRYAVIQRGYCAFSIGSNRNDALSSCIGVLECENEDGNKFYAKTISDVEAEISNERVNGAIAIIDSDDPEWSEYVN